MRDLLGTLHELMIRKADEGAKQTVYEAMSVAIALGSAWEILPKLGDELKQADGFAVRNALITYALIQTRDALMWLDRRGFRVVDVGPLIQQHGKEGDLTGLISTARNAACHIGSPLHTVSANTFSWHYMGPGGGVLLGRLEITNRTQDDLAVAFGDVVLYLKNNLVLAMTRAGERLVELSESA